MRISFVGRCFRNGRRQVIQKDLRSKHHPDSVEKTDNSFSEDLQVIPVVNFENEDKSAGLYLKPNGLWIIQYIEKFQSSIIDKNTVINQWDYITTQFERLGDAVDWIKERFEYIDVVDHVFDAIHVIDLEISRWVSQIHCLDQSDREIKI